ncbi:exodeoxyribonuclease-3 [Actinobaculum suis]|uniref:Exodeoxyribonuclease III n=1 Tax=Actinobaculum suis TaxID=1657 RepID=A0A1G7AND5_9ACTO|nr:exodeoxyribonuclease III [Actinobaculum suis]MDY5153373.1 exodeoxyribonuclease III [Actinobaculum suis]SDE16220.1 exodeoxyribonuclease-3 [Actinobaculum suis]
MKITTVNVNGLRAADRKGMGAWVQDTAPDVLLMQEVRAPREAITKIFQGSGYRVFNAISTLKGRAGVSVAVREEIQVGEVRIGLADPGETPAVVAAGHATETPATSATANAAASTAELAATSETPVDTGRWLEVDLPDCDLTVVSAYLHSGVATDAAKMAAKYSHLDRVTQRLASFDQTAKILVAGDFNIVHTEADIKNWKPNHNKTAGVLDSEIAYLEDWFASGWVDVQRALLTAEGYTEKGPYTWWSQRGKAFDNDAGWRIDYHMATPALAAQARSFAIGRAESYAARWSDHAPLTVEYEL